MGFRLQYDRIGPAPRRAHYGPLGEYVLSAHRSVLGPQPIVRPFADQRVVIVGLARQGSALARFFCAQGASVVVTDLRSADQLRVDVPSTDGVSVEGASAEIASLAGLSNE